jgi:multidrug efflux pump
VTFFGLLLTPVFFVVIDRVSEADPLRSSWLRRISDAVLLLVSLRWVPQAVRVATPIVRSAAARARGTFPRI